MERSYKRTLTACYLGFVTQAISANFAPLLYLTFHRSYGIPLGRIAMISTVFFLTQLVVDILCARYVDRIGYRKCILASCLCSAGGLMGLVVFPELLGSPFWGILPCAVVYAVGSGLIEVLCSPMVEACPFPRKEAVMSLLHSFYCWGSVGVVIASTVFFRVFGIERWKLLACLWALVPLLNIYNFATCPIEPPVKEGQSMSIGSLLRIPVFWTAIVLMVCAGASELAMAQWASAYTESAIGLSKAAGDIAGPCLFAVAMGISRMLYGKFGHRMDLMQFMYCSGALCLICYLLAALSRLPFVGLTGCILCGFSVGILWPGTISISSARLPRGGTAMFALLAMAGDLGGALGPWLVGNVSELTGNSLQKGLLAGSVFPLILMLALGSMAILTGKQSTASKAS